MGRTKLYSVDQNIWAPCQWFCRSLTSVVFTHSLLYVVGNVPISSSSAESQFIRKGNKIERIILAPVAILCCYLKCNMCKLSKAKRTAAPSNPCLFGRKPCLSSGISSSISVFLNCSCWELCLPGLQILMVICTLITYSLAAQLCARLLRGTAYHVQWNLLPCKLA